ncbi:hypothetical protein JXA12_03265 [Candidatus Woesearchaeota archaeon]|nr:hypothetical protein [Candidatus Woesearchaeota archaeon]
MGTNKQREERWLLFLLLALLVPAVSGVGYAPITVIGQVEGATDGMTASLWTTVGGVELRSERVAVDGQGLFVAVVTVPDGAVVDLQVLLVGEESYVEVVEGAAAWGTYNVTLTIGDAVLAAPAPPSATGSLFDPVFEGDVAAFTDGEADAALLDKYGVEVDAWAPSPPVGERPTFLLAPPRGESWGVHPVVLELAAVVIIAFCFFLIRHELYHRRV